MKKICFLLPTIFVFVYSCSKDSEIKLSDNNYLVFGHFYGECFGEGCVETFKLTNTKVYEDILDSYSGDDFSFTELENDKFEQVKDLIDYFPEELLLVTETHIGCPDCADQGGILIQLVNGDNVRSWRIDQSKSATPNYLHEFMDKVNEKIGLINN